MIVTPAEDSDDLCDGTKGLKFGNSGTIQNKKLKTNFNSFWSDHWQVRNIQLREYSDISNNNNNIRNKNKQ